jgi:2,3-bisphosphoglycerate-dependent phosphoglycerate mutase
LYSGPRYADLPPGILPLTESLTDVQARVLPYWVDVLCGDLVVGRTPLVVAHGNSLRALVTHLDRLDPDEVAQLNIPTGIPLRYELDAHSTPVERHRRYLDPDTAAIAAAAIARE